ncbi:MAG: SCP2 sterol-binding domain-containing protein [Actinomycetota bacterium]
MASTEEVQTKLEQLIARLGANEEAARELERSLPDPRILGLHVTDHDVHFWTELAGGRLGPLHQERHERAHIRVAAGSDDLIALVDGGSSLFSAYVSGRVRVEASFSDLLKLRRLT